MEIEDDPYNPTFQPSLPYSPLREKVLSSGYGNQVAKIPKHEVAQELPSFKPELPKNELREKVSSSGYGKVLITPVKKEVGRIAVF